MLRHEAIRAFLIEDYRREMECQVNAAQDGGERVDGEFQGRAWHGWTDGLTTWKSYRINCAELADKRQSWDLEAHVESIGMTGWNWDKKQSEWVAFDFDSIINHTKGLNHNELSTILDAVSRIDWCSIRRSTSGSGYHIYVYLTPVPTASHTEHAALARDVLNMMSGVTGLDLRAKVDVCGGNMWVWHRKQRGTNGLQWIKRGTKLEHVARGTISDADVSAAGTARPRISLSPEHTALINYLESINAFWWWDNDKQMLVTHTHWLERAHAALNMRGVFKTASAARNPQEQNCFAFPMHRGAWAVRRFTRGAAEHESWEQDSAGWTRTYLNADPSISTACRTNGGLELPKGGFVFTDAAAAKQAAEALGVNMIVGPIQERARTVLKEHKDGRLIARVERGDRDRPDDMPGWLADGGDWVRIYSCRTSKIEEESATGYDELVRHLVTCDGADAGWVLKSDGVWRQEPLGHIERALTSLGYNNKDKQSALGNSIFKPWKIVNIPFAAEYPGDREWNRDSAQLRYMPGDGKHHPHWSKILDHCGRGLDAAVSTHPWCVLNGIKTGGDYLKCWIASVLQFPLEPLPYLFLYSREQVTGKSIFHEALEHLFIRGYQLASSALRSQAGFNKELAGAVLCVVEEIDLRTNKQAYNMIKDWVTSRTIQIHPKGETPYTIKNSTHWIHCANDSSFCPIQEGDTRITMIHVPPLDPGEEIPKAILLAALAKEAPDFINDVLSLQIPPPLDRLRIPVIETSIKRQVTESSLDPLDLFIKEEMKVGSGRIKFSTFVDLFHAWLVNQHMESSAWTKIKIGRSLKYPRGRARSDEGQMYIAGFQLPSEADTRVYHVDAEGWM